MDSEWDAADRKPDVIGVFVSYLKKKFPSLSEEEFEEWQVEVSKGSQGVIGKKNSMNIEESAYKTRWSDVHQTWELKKHRKVACDGLYEEYSKDDVCECVFF